MKYFRIYNTDSDLKSERKDLEKPWVSNITDNNAVYYSYPVDYEYEYFAIEALENGTFTFSNNLYYSIDDGETWVELTAGTASPEIETGNKILWKQSGLTPTSSGGIGTFTSTGNFDISGNIMSLLDGDDFVNSTSIASNAFFKLFDSSKLVSAKNLALPIDTLSASCYKQMFSRCRLLVEAPVLPATTMANACYLDMFFECTTLKVAPKLPAETLAIDCYRSMFNKCYALTTTPVLSVKELKSSCYQSMFKACTSLVEAPELPATTLVSNCYTDMFNGCTSLNYIKALFTTTPGTGYTDRWVQGVNTLPGTFVKSSEATWDVTGPEGVPSGWDIQTE